MGYTHYWELNPNGKKKDLSGCLGKIKEVILQHADIIQYEEDKAKLPLVSNKLIRFNGIGNDGHETFYFEYPPKKKVSYSVDDDGFIFAFCKTARKPYDIVVCKCLLILKEYLKEDMKLSSDGDWNCEDEWKPAIEQVTKMGIDIVPCLVVDEI